MNIQPQHVTLPTAELADLVAPDCHGLNFYEIDRSLQDLLTLYVPEDLRVHLQPHLERFGALVGNEVDDWSRLSDRHPPVLHHRDPRGRFEDWIEFHPAYRNMEDVALGEFGLAAMIHKAGVLGWGSPMSHTVKFIFQYVFGQSEFGQLCPISATETTATLIKDYGDEATKARFYEGLTSQDTRTMLKGAQFMTERTGGSDVSNIQLEARFEDGNWRLYGEKWFCSCTDGDVALLLARPQGAPAGNEGLGLFALPRRLDDGSRNAYRIVRLKNKLGSRSMASGEIVFNGAVAYPLGKVGTHENNGLKLMMDQVSLSRLSHGCRAASMMRRCLNEAMVTATNRQAFKEKIIDKPLLRRQLMKLMVPTEQALSITLYLGNQITLAEAGDERAQMITRILTPAHKYRTARDNVRVATGAMEVRGGNGYIEDFVNARLVRDAHLGVLWEGTSNINSLDITTRAIAKVGAHKHLKDELVDQIDKSAAMPGQFRGELRCMVQQAIDFAADVATSGNQTLARKAASAVYNSATATLLATEGSALGEAGRDARRLLLARMVIDHRLRAQDPLKTGESSFEQEAIDLLLSPAPVSLDQATDVLTR
ncbi:acyl-CoA dehydrogenase family protein [Roseibium sp. RKSG952]|uniref:acyl-CoA dehydrogenase family protein n=1 Tax=Roseibium sp. RKSG952 TaxID=2529384 RepID=UPI0012BD7355|nr:acyl-CoA dehydrogenase family protein [Roseibium sp. RKSG952]MTH96188.1 DNA alkylation response protein [Roseibium sp. RKSG952]